MIDDTYILDGVESRLEHSPPFTSEELQSIEAVGVKGLEEPGQLCDIPNLTVLDIESADVSDLTSFKCLKKLRNLGLIQSRVGSLQGIEELESLRYLFLRYSSVNDLSPLRKAPLPKLKYVGLTGNPLSRESRHEMVPELEDRGIVVETDDDAVWQINCKLADRDIPLSAERKDDDSDILRLWMVGPRDERLERYERPNIPLAELDAWLERDDHDLEALFREWQPERPKVVRDVDAFDYQSHTEHVSVGTVRASIESADFDDQLGEALLRLTEDFSEHRFYQEDDALLDHVEERHGVELPGWLRNVRKTLAYVLTDKPHMGSNRQHVRFSTSRNAWRTDGKAYDWSSMGIYGRQTRELLCEKHGFFPFGQGGTHGEQWLLIDVTKPEDRAVYAMMSEDLREDEAPEAVKIFDDISQMYESIESLCMMDGTVVVERR